MNIVIVSKDSFFISGAISLIQDAWQPHYKGNPVFLVAEAHKELLTADIIITDEVKADSTSGNNPLTQALRISEALSKERRMSIWLAAPCHAENRSCQQHKFQVDKSKSKRRLADLFSRKTVPNCASINIYDPHRCGTHDPIVLSKQQAMVVKYTRQGLSLTDISRLTCLSVKTISTHKRAVMRKLGMKNNSDFYRYALVGANPP
ncbi:helix-turn-helix domain-containing protein [Erwinia sp.]|uniref:helix-turn-helix domain-containing protein n=1 Tax=Erwinia citreus TaxID=558 RepID=UPI003C70C822